MQSFGHRKHEPQPSRLADNVRVRLREQLQPKAQVDVASERHPPPDPYAADQTPQVTAPPPDETNDLGNLQAGLNGLSDAQLQSVLGQLPAHQLAKVLERLLSVVKPDQPTLADAASDPADQRAAERHKTRRIGKIVYNNNMCVHNCEIRDMSDTGCRVAVDSTTGIPEFFTLHIQNGDVGHECQVAWRKADMMGLQFLAQG